MKNLPRRTFITAAATGISLLAGCSTDSDTESEPERQELASGTWDIEEDSYRYWELPIEESVQLEYSFTVQSGPSIDVLLMDDRAFGHFENTESYNYLPSGSVMDAAGQSEEVELPPDNYVLVIDNTEAGEASPPTNFEDDTARVEFEAYLTIL